jgi:GNAT superfamily N-acetyltransferase
VKTVRRVTVRRATSADLETVVDLRLSLLREYREHPVYGRIRSDAENVAHDVFARQLASNSETSFVAECDGKPVGLMRCVEMVSSPLLVPDRYCYVSSVYVRPEFRRRGVLRSLFAKARDWCAERGLTEMRLHSVDDHSGAAAAWDALGFDVVEQVRVRRLTPSPSRASHATDAPGRSHIHHPRA